MSQTNGVKEVPNSKTSEMMVLGCMLNGKSHLKFSADNLSDTDFFYIEHRIIFQALKNAYLKNKNADVHLISEDLKNQEKLKSVGGVGYIATLSQFAGVSSHIEEYVDEVANKSLLRKLINANQLIEKEALDGSENPFQLIEKLQTEIRSLESRNGKRIPIIDTQERLRVENKFLNTYRGEKYLGLCVKTISEFNENFLGLRGLTLLAAAPNVGKTALTVQTALEVLATEKDACLAYISLEMSEEQIFRRMLLHLSGLNFRTFVFGSQVSGSRENISQDVFFTQDEWESIKKAENTLADFGSRLQIIDQSSCPYIDAKTVVNYVEAIKAKTQCSRVIVIIDYLQVWPISPNVRTPSENEADKWRIGEMKKIRDAMKDDPVIVISEARKPSGKDELWGSDLSDVMGSARGTYTPDVVMLLSQVSPKALNELWKKNGLPEVKIQREGDMSESEKIDLSIKNFLADLGISICKLEVPKARDGMQKFSILLEFHFHKNTFRKVNWNELKKLAKNGSPYEEKTRDLFGNRRIKNEE